MSWTTVDALIDEEGNADAGELRGASVVVGFVPRVEIEAITEGTRYKTGKRVPTTVSSKRARVIHAKLAAGVHPRLIAERLAVDLTTIDYHRRRCACDERERVTT